MKEELTKLSNDLTRFISWLEMDELFESIYDKQKHEERCLYKIEELSSKINNLVNNEMTTVMHQSKN